MPQAATTRPVFRFAPSPNGRLHLGHAYSALLNDKMARASGGRLLLRIEDTDITRSKPEYVTAICDDLAWLGLKWEEPVRVQSQHFADYENTIAQLREAGHVYPCFCSRKQAAQDALATRDPESQPHYGGTCRALPRAEAEYHMQFGTPFGWRLKTDGTAARIWGDVMIAKPRTGSWYHIAVVVDDGLQGVTHVVRGQDVEAATSIHALLQRRLGLPQPQYHHHKLLTDATGAKLSKSRHSTTLATMRDSGISPATLRRQLGFD